MSDETAFQQAKYQAENYCSEAQALYDNFKEEGLSLGMVEAEGYLRAMKTIVHMFEDIEELEE